MVSSPDTAIEVRGVHRQFGSVQALRDVSFSIQRHGVVGLLGPNGAGKTTLMRILAGTLAPTSGHATVGGHDVLLDARSARRQLGWLPEGAPAYGEMTVRGYLRFVARMRGLAPSERTLGIEQALEACSLEDRVHQTIATLSRGYRQRVGLAAALLHQPPILVLDEPTTGLDPNQVTELRALVRDLARTRTVLLSTHVLSEARAVCDRVIILHRGQVAADDRTERITAAATGTACVVGLGESKVQASLAELESQISAIPGVSAVHPLQGDHPRFEVHADHDVRPHLFRWAVDRGHVLVELTEQRRSLEEVFRSLTEAP